MPQKDTPRPGAAEIEAAKQVEIAQQYRDAHNRSLPTEVLAKELKEQRIKDLKENIEKLLGEEAHITLETNFLEFVRNTEGGFNVNYQNVAYTFDNMLRTDKHISYMEDKVTEKIAERDKAKAKAEAAAKAEAETKAAEEARAAEAGPTESRSAESGPAINSTLCPFDVGSHVMFCPALASIMSKL